MGADATLKSEVEALRAQVAELQARLAVQERAPEKAKSAGDAASSGSEGSSAELQTSMTESQVAQAAMRALHGVWSSASIHPWLCMSSGNQLSDGAERGARWQAWGG